MYLRPTRFKPSRDRDGTLGTEGESPQRTGVSVGVPPDSGPRPGPRGQWMGHWDPSGTWEPGSVGRGRYLRRSDGLRKSRLTPPRRDPSPTHRPVPEGLPPPTGPFGSSLRPLCTPVPCVRCESDPSPGQTPVAQVKRDPVREPFLLPQPLPLALGPRGCPG